MPQATSLRERKDLAARSDNYDKALSEASWLCYASYGAPVAEVWGAVRGQDEAYIVFPAEQRHYWQAELEAEGYRLTVSLTGYR